MNCYKVGKKVKTFRLRSGMSQLDLELEIGASSGSICRIERGITNPTKETLVKISNALSLSLTEKIGLFGFGKKNERTFGPKKNLSHSVFSYSKYYNLWTSGRIKVLTQDAEKKSDDLSFFDYVLLSHSYKELGQFSSSLSTISVLRESVKSCSDKDYLTSLIDATEFNIASELYNIDRCEILNRNIKDSLSFNNSRYIKGIYYLNCGELYEIKENFDLAYKNLGTSFIYLDVENHPFEILRALLALQRISFRSLQKNTIDYLKNMKLILNMFPESHFHALLNWRYANYFFFNMSDTERGCLSIKKQRMIARKTFSKKYENCADLTYLEYLLTYGQINKASKYASNRFSDKSIDFYLKNNYLLGVMKSFLISRFSYKSGMSEIHRLLKENKENVRPSTHEFYFGACKFIYGKDIEEREVGRKGLIKLMSSSAVGILRNLAKSTLNNKMILVDVKIN